MCARDDLPRASRGVLLSTPGAHLARREEVVEHGRVGAVCAHPSVTVLACIALALAARPGAHDAVTCASMSSSDASGSFCTLHRAVWGVRAGAPGTCYEARDLGKVSAEAVRARESV